jgi:hypothetical protein
MSIYDFDYFDVHLPDAFHKNIKEVVDRDLLLGPEAAKSCSVNCADVNFYLEFGVILLKSQFVARSITLTSTPRTHFIRISKRLSTGIFCLGLCGLRVAV